METIGKQAIWTFLQNARNAREATCTEIRKDAGHQVRDYMELAKKVAELQFKNRDFVFMFRGQRHDYKNKSKNTSLKPSLLRANTEGKVPTPNQLQHRFQRLQRAEQRLVAAYYDKELVGLERMRRQQILRWSVLQHYVVCRTPVLDVTHSLRISASFASDGATDEAYVFVLGVPNLSGAITASAEAGLQIVRLSSVCPPTALRPHIQEGYMLAEYPEMAGYEQKQLYSHYEIDFGRRLIAKFRFDPQSFWKKNGAFPKVEHAALYPDKYDPIFRLAQSIKTSSPS